MQTYYVEFVRNVGRASLDVQADAYTRLDGTYTFYERRLKPLPNVVVCEIEVQHVLFVSAKEEEATSG